MSFFLFCSYLKECVKKKQKTDKLPLLPQAVKGAYKNVHWSFIGCGDLLVKSEKRHIK
jgi:hypothetical protein